jgi:acyl-CoA reductase-like NAD-dependent aldehyde dehydrogenase
MEILNYIGGEWVKPSVSEWLDVINPATGQVVARTPLSSRAEVDAGAGARPVPVPVARPASIQSR